VQPDHSILVPIIGVLLSGLVHATPTAYTQRAVFDAALSGTPAILDFDSATANALIPSGGALDGITFAYAFGGVSLKVATEPDSSYSTTSSAQFLGTDDADILQDGDSLTLSFGPARAIGLYVISNDALADNDLSLSAGGVTVNLIAADVQGAPLGDGSTVHFLGLVDTAATFTSATLNTAGNGAFLFNLDDLISAPDHDEDALLNADDNCTEVANPDQTDSDGDLFGNACDADLNNDCVVNGLDVGTFIAQFGTAGPDADFNNDGVVNGLDVGPFITMFGNAPGPSGLAPVCSL
jgi:hypothetical protein